MSLIRKKENIRKLLIEIIDRLNLRAKFTKETTFRNLSEFLYKFQLISIDYCQKITSLDSNELKNSDLNDIKLYLLTRFYHYI